MKTYTVKMQEIYEVWVEVQAESESEARSNAVHDGGMELTDPIKVENHASDKWEVSEQ